MKISVVTVVRNDPRVATAVESVLRQVGDVEVEAVVIDGASTDATVDVLGYLSARGAVVVSEPDDGIYDAMNKGISIASGDVVAFLGADDQYKDSGVLAEVARVLTSGGLDACYADLEYVDSEGRVRRRWRSGSPDRWKWYCGWMPPHPTFFARRELFDSLGGFDTGCRIAADYELMHRFLFEHRIRAAYVPRVFVSMGMWGTSNAGVRQVTRANLEVARCWRNSGLLPSALVPLLKLSRKPLQFLGCGFSTPRR